MVTAADKARALYDAYVSGVYGIRDMSDYENLTETGLIKNDEEYDFLANTLNDGEFSSEDEAAFKEREYAAGFIQEIATKWGSGSAVDKRREFLLGAVVDDDYSDTARVTMLEELLGLGVGDYPLSKVKNLVKNLKDSNRDIRVGTLAWIAMAEDANTGFFNRMIADLKGLMSQNYLYIDDPALDPAFAEAEVEAIFRWAAMIADQTSGDRYKESVKCLKQIAFNHMNPVMREAALHVAARQDAPDLWDKVFSKLSCDDSEVRELAKGAVLENGEKLLLPLLAYGNSHQHRWDYLKSVAEEIMQKMETTRLVDLFFKAETRLIEEFVIRERTADAIHYLRRLAMDDKFDKRLDAIKFLGRAGGKNVLADMEVLFMDDDPSVREAAFHEICRMEGVNIRPYVEKGLKDPDISVRLDVVDVISYNQQTHMLTYLGLALENSSEDVQERALEAFLRYVHIPEFRRGILSYLVLATKITSPDNRIYAWKIIKDNYPGGDYLSHAVDGCKAGDDVSCLLVDGALRDLSPPVRALESLRLVTDKNFYLHAVGGKNLWESAILFKYRVESNRWYRLFQ